MVALAVLKFVEIAIDLSPREFVDMLKDVTDTQVRYRKTNEEFFWRSQIPESTKFLMDELLRPH